MKKVKNWRRKTWFMQERGVCRSSSTWPKMHPGQSPPRRPEVEATYEGDERTVWVPKHAGCRLAIYLVYMRTMAPKAPRLMAHSRGDASPSPFVAPSPRLETRGVQVRLTVGHYLLHFKTFCSARNALGRKCVKNLIDFIFHYLDTLQTRAQAAREAKMRTPPPMEPVSIWQYAHLYSKLE